MGRLLVGAAWAFNRPQLKYYDIDTKEIILINDNKYKNWWLSKKKPDNTDERVKLYDALHDKTVSLYKHEYGKPDEGEENWEHKLRKHHNYLLSKQLITGAIYDINGRLEKSVLNQTQRRALQTMIGNALDDPEYEAYLKSYTDILSQPIPDFKRVAIDIEVATVNGVFPDLEKADNDVTCIGFASNDGYRATYTLNKYHERSDEQLDYVTYFDDEKDLLRAAMLKIKQYPMVITFNGDQFDLAYLYMRCKKLDIPTPITFNEFDIYRNYLQSDAVLLQRGIHLDLFRIFQNRSLHNYAFNAKYKQFGLDPIAQAMIGEGKIKNDKPLMELNQEELSKYCLNDAEITLKLTTYANGLLMKLLILISRITKTSIEDIGRFGISNWIKQMLYFEHRKKKILIPNRDELFIKGAGETNATIKGKKYAGAMVITPETGAYFNVSVVDFASLYPSIIKEYNLSYESINCGHNQCKRHKIPETTHYTCTKKMGMIPLLIGVFRDLRVEYFKKLSKDKTLSQDERDIYDAVSQAVKVILNGAYGVLGADNFQLYCLPVAESVTAVGRHIITETKKYVEDLGLKVIYGDTDSLFVHNADQEQLKTMIKRTNNKYGIDLEVDKTYRYIIFAKRKKNYLGVKDDGKLDVKGLVGKKSHIPKIIKQCFNDVSYVLQKVQNKYDLDNAKVTIGDIIKKCNANMSDYVYPIEYYAFTASLNKKIESYGEVVQEEGLDKSQFDLYNHRIYNKEIKKGVPIHVKVAQEMEDEGEEIALKQYIPYIKCRGGVGKPISKASHTDIDIEKYRETLESVCNPILEVLDMEYQTIALHQQKTLDEIFG
jgi:DNA polymerase I